jgi:hypothetical protein
MDSYRIAIEPRDDYLHVDVSGTNTPETIRRYSNDIRDACTRTGVFKVLVVVHLHGAPLSMLDVYKAIAQASDAAAGLGIRVAYVEPNPERSQVNLDIGETVARTRGIPAQTFRDVAAAAAWLRSIDTKPE